MVVVIWNGSYFFGGGEGSLMDKRQREFFFLPRGVVWANPVNTIVYQN